MKGVSFRRANHAELKLPPLAKVRWLGGRIFLPEAGILVRLRSLGVAVLIRENVHPGKMPVFMVMVKYRYFPLWCSLCFGHSSGRGARIKILRELFYGNLSAYHKADWECLFRNPGGEILGSARSQIGRLSLIWLFVLASGHSRYTQTGTCVRLGMAVAYSRYKFVTAVPLPERLRNCWGPPGPRPRQRFLS
jgi:hypothetical protein